MGYDIGALYLTGVGGQESVDIGPYLEGLGVEIGCEYGCSVVAATAPEVGDFVFVVGSGRDESRHQNHTPGSESGRCESGGDGGVGGIGVEHVLAKPVDSLYEASGIE